MTAVDAIVVGGGISGLAAAQRLETMGCNVLLVEASDRLGGQISTDHDGGFVIEHGPDSFVAGKGDVLELAETLGISHRVIPSRPDHRGSDVWWDGRLHPLPDGLLLIAPSRLLPILGSSIFSWRGKLRVLADLVLPRSTHGGDETLESFVVRRLGREMLDRVAQPLVAGIHAADPDTMSLRASFPRFLEMEQRHRSLILAAKALPTPANAEGLSYFASFGAGMGELCAALVSSLRSTDVRLGLGVVGLTAPASGGYDLAMSNGDVATSRHVVVATPAPVAARLFAETVPEAARALREIRQAPATTVSLAYESARIPPLTGYGFVVPSVQERRLLGVTYSSQKWEGRVPDLSFTLVRAFVGDRHRDGDQAALRALVTEELRTMLGITAPPVKTWTTTQQAVLHRYTIGHLDRVAAVESSLSRRPGLTVAGSALYGIGLNECISSGRRAADRAVGPAPLIEPSDAATQKRR